MYQSNQPSLMNLLGTMAIFVIAAGYGIISLSTEDPLWFIPTFSEQADEITLYCRGSEESISPDSPYFSELNGMINEALSGPKNWDPLTMSEETYAYYQTSDAVVVLEYHYAERTRVHSLYKYFSGFDDLVVPVEGRHSKLNAVFARVGDQNTAGSLHIQSSGLLMDYLSANGLCSR